MDETEESPEAKSASSLLDQPKGADWALAQLVFYAELGVEVDVTLTVGGGLVTGRIIGGKKYFEAIAGAFRTASVKGDGSIADTLAAGMESNGELYPSAEEIGDLSEFKPTFIHLDNAKYLNGNGLPIPSNGNGVAWRGKLSAVDGFNIGSMSAS